MWLRNLLRLGAGRRISSRALQCLSNMFHKSPFQERENPKRYIPSAENTPLKSKSSGGKKNSEIAAGKDDDENRDPNTKYNL